jgi:sigma-E factor negative regulatory protein RseB
LRFILLALALLVVPARAQDDLSAKTWLENMSQALKTSQFKASIVQLQADQFRPLVYLHAIVDNQEVAFLEYLNGPPKNAVRVGNTVTFIEHDQPAYSVHAKRIQGVWPQAFAGDIARLEAGYRFVLGGRSRIAGRPGQMIRFIPNDSFRYSFQVWLDMETFLPLRYDMLNQDKVLIEQMMVVELLMLPEPPPLLIEAYKQEWPPVMNPAERADGRHWHFSWLPTGFRVIIRDNHRLIGSNESVEYIALTDGLSNISVYMAKPGQAPLPEELMTRNGLSLVTETVGNMEVVAVGKVPSDTLVRIVKSLTLE